jgi:hypothetical protein
MNRSLAYILTFGLLFVVGGDAFAQFSMLKKRWQDGKVPEKGMVIVVGAGVAAVKSDICGSWGCNDFGPSVSVGAIYRFTSDIGAGINADYLRLGAREKDPEQPLNVAFRSEVISLTGIGVYNLLDSYAGSGNYRSSRKRFIVPFLKAGAGIVYYTATSYPAENDLDESQTTYDPEREYPAVSLVIPFGAGLRFRFSDELAIAPELAYHITTSDYLDNIGPRLGNPLKDHYGLFSVKLMYTPIVKNNVFSRNKK